MAKLRVGILFGGRSGEHEVSIRSAQSVVSAIDRERFDLELIGIDRLGAWHLHDEQGFARLDRDAGAAGRKVMPAAGNGALRVLDVRSAEQSVAPLDVVFPVLHGPYGEDGTIQGLLETIDVPYVGAGVLGSAIGMDKDVQKRLLRDSGIPVVPFEVCTERTWKGQRAQVEERALPLGLPLFVKPASLGSSLGVRKVESASALADAVEHALSLDTKILIERGINGREIECSVLGNDDPRASFPGEIEPGEKFYSYDDKYSAASKARLLIPAPLAPEIVESLRQLAVRAFLVTECSGMARVDFFLEHGTNQLFINELNTIPGFTSISMYPKMWEASGIAYRALISLLIDFATERHSARQRLRGG